MYSIKSHIRQLVSLLTEHGIKQVVLCPGSRNAPIVQTIAGSNQFVCHSVVDERSAGFYAIGLSLATHEAVAVCCTSGSALLNLCPAVAEAYYQRIPLLVISGDRPQRWINQMDGQTITQTGVFNDYIKKEVQLVEEEDYESKWYNNRIINEAICELTHAGCGPTHINVPITEPLFDFSATSLPEERVIKLEESSLSIFPQLGEYWHLYNKILVVYGQTPTASTLCNLNIWKAKGCVTLCELLSNSEAGGHQVTNFDAMLCKCSEEQQQAELVPDLVISLGGHIVSKQLKNFLRKHHVRHWLVHPDGKITDTFMNADKVFICSEKNFMKHITELPPKDNAFQTAWWTLSDEVERKSACYFTSIGNELSAMNMLRRLMHQLGGDATLILANSMSVRLAQLFHSSHYCIPTLCNRGVNGIEGSMSTAVGYATACDRLCVLVIGDLSFFYDMNILRHASNLSNLRILLVNNGGGEIFQTLQGLENATARNKYISACHTTCAQGWAENVGFEYLKVTDSQNMNTALDMLLNPDSGSPVLIEVLTDSYTDNETLKNYYKSL